MTWVHVLFELVFWLFLQMVKQNQALKLSKIAEMLINFIIKCVHHVWDADIHALYPPPKKLKKILGPEMSRGRKCLWARRVSDAWIGITMKYFNICYKTRWYRMDPTMNCWTQIQKSWILTLIVSKWCFISL